MQWRTSGASDAVHSRSSTTSGVPPRHAAPQDALTPLAPEHGAQVLGATLARPVTGNEVRAPTRWNRALRRPHAPRGTPPDRWSCPSRKLQKSAAAMHAFRPSEAFGRGLLSTEGTLRAWQLARTIAGVGRVLLRERTRKPRPEQVIAFGKGSPSCSPPSHRGAGEQRGRRCRLRRQAAVLAAQHAAAREQADCSRASPPLPMQIRDCARGCASPALGERRPRSWANAQARLVALMVAEPRVRAYAEPGASRPARRPRPLRFVHTGSAELDGRYSASTSAAFAGRPAVG